MKLIVKFFVVIGLGLLVLNACAKASPDQTVLPVKNAPEFVEFYSPF